VDIALDTYPYQGTHTTLETLTMSVPVITLCGETYVRRASSALLMRLGLNDLVAPTPEVYVNLAVELAGKRSLLKELRSRLREQFLTSEICDVGRFEEELEATYRALWVHWCQAEAHPTDTGSR
jgi:protein O-GlcNAc transferase